MTVQCQACWSANPCLRLQQCNTINSNKKDTVAIPDFCQFRGNDFKVNSLAISSCLGLVLPGCCRDLVHQAESLLYSLRSSSPLCRACGQIQPWVSRNTRVPGTNSEQNVDMLFLNLSKYTGGCVYVRNQTEIYMLKLGSELKGKLKTYPCVSVSCEEGYAIYNIYKKGRSLLQKWGY